MNETQFHLYISDFPIACTYQQMIEDECGKPYDYEYLYVNKAFETMFKTDSSAIIGRTLRNTASYETTELNNWIEKCVETLLTRTAYDKATYDTTFKKWILAKIIPITDNQFLIMFTDIQDQTLNKIQIEGFFTSNLDLMCITDIDGIFIKVNEEFEYVFGYTINELEGSSYLPLVHKDDIAVTLETMNNLKNQNPVRKFLNRYHCKDGTYRNIEWKVHPIGDIVYFSGRDVTTFLQMQEKLEQRNSQLDKLSKDLKEANSTLEFIATKDKLTGLYNRYYFDQNLSHEMEIADRYNEPLSMLIYDLDHFKCVNDNFGHSIGDEVLKFTSSVFSNVIRNTDMAFRIGGEEFCLLMPRTTLDKALGVAEKIRLSFEQSIHPIAGRVTASFGVAERFKAESYKSWYNRTDEALYASKHKGRNQVTGASTNDLPTTMAKIDWNDKWNSGNIVIDNQHRELLELASVIFHDAYATNDKDEFIITINNLLSHISHHFTTEATILMNYHYPDLEQHKTIHSYLLHKAEKLKSDYLADEVKASIFFSFLLDEVLMDHLLKEDVKFFPLLKS